MSGRSLLDVRGGGENYYDDVSRDEASRWHWKNTRLSFLRVVNIRGGVHDSKDLDEEFVQRGTDGQDEINTQSIVGKVGNDSEYLSISSTKKKRLESVNAQSEIKPSRLKIPPYTEKTAENDEFNPTLRSNTTNAKDGSFLSFFRKQFSTLSNEATTYIAPESFSELSKKKILLPHGQDGRGGGGTTASMFATDGHHDETVAGDFVISSNTSEDFGANAAGANTDTNETTEYASSASSTKKKSEIGSSLKSGGDSVAFLVAPTASCPNKKVKLDNQGTKVIEKATSTPVGSGKEIDNPSAKEKIFSSNASVNEESSAELQSRSSNNYHSISSHVNMADEEVSTNKTLNQTATNTTLASNGTLGKEYASDASAVSTGDYISSGYWIGIDLVASFGLSTLSDDLKISRVLRPVRKAAAKATGLHGILSGKERNESNIPKKTIIKMENDNALRGKKPTVISIDEELGIHDSGAYEAEKVARRVILPRRRGRRGRQNRQPPTGRRWGLRRGGRRNNNQFNSYPEYLIVPAKNLDSSPDAMEQRRRKRVEEIDKLIQRGSARLLELQCEKDDLQRSPNPLFNYTKKYDPSTNQTFGDVRTSREFNFPPSDLVNEYIDELVSHGRLIRLNHTDLWQGRSGDEFDDDDDEIVGDDLLTPSANARRLYENLDELERGINHNNKGTKTGHYTSQNSGGGSWLLRRGFGRNGGSLGEKLGETIETAAYKAVCSSVMMVLARLLSALHGTNIMSHSDIRLYIEQDPDLPPVDKKYGPHTGDNYAQEAIKTAIRKAAKKKKKGDKSHRHTSRRHGHELSDDAFIQRDAVVETLISHCQISAPLLKLFPLDWQRAMVGNIITLATAVVSDFADGLHVQLLGHALSFSFKPITEADMIQQIGVGGFRQNHRRARPEEFEEAVWATAQDISESLSFLDGWLEWLERKLGGGILRSQIGNLIARVVLTLIDEVLSGARLDLWSSQANGPRLFGALEYRATSSKESYNIFD